MSTQKSKFALFSKLQDMGFTYEEAVALRRIEMTPHRWAELECGNENGYSSYCITRDELAGKPRMEVHPYDRAMFSYPVADRERGALKRLAAIVKARNEREGAKSGLVHAYHQTDCRGCAVYVVRERDLREVGDTGPLSFSEAMASYYTRGLAVCA